ncbi:hypothetical protein [Rhodococcus kronopolitis]|uniref:Uncharacterized protein n=1 Tax=Rhodococcus kronopolitis TaxID=1460226 RepID=A0ABV9FQT3_9NOCA
MISKSGLFPALRSSADLAKTVSDSTSEWSMWLKQTPESAQAIKEYGLTESGVTGVAWAMAGARGDIKQCLKTDTTTARSNGEP